MTASPSSDPAGHEPPVRGCLEACERCRILVETVCGQEDPPAREAYAAIGPHLRHCIEHFICLLGGIRDGAVDYDARERDRRMERDPQYFLAVLNSVVRDLRALESLDRSIAARQESAAGGGSETVTTTVKRELMFLSSHTIHHIAIMSLLAERAGVAVPLELGVAFSTESFMRRAAERPGS